MTVDFLEFLKSAKGRFAFVATYEFDPLFFERRILPMPAFDGASVVVFVDNDRYCEILAAGRQGSGFDRDYFVIPIRRAAGVFHPKLYLAIGDKKAIGSVGSNNCTSAGTGHNFELISTLESSEADRDGIGGQMIAAIFQLFQRYAKDAGPVSKWLERDVFGQAVEDFPWLADRSEAAQGVELLASHDRPLWPMIVARLAGKEVRKVAMMAPFFDRKLQIVERIKALWPQAAIQVVSQSGYSNLPIERLLALRDVHEDVELISATSRKAGRNLHAKALAFQTPDCTYWLAGSANMSHAALAGGNSEACLWFATKQTAPRVLKQDQLTFASVDPEDFEASAIDEPAPPADRSHGLKLFSVILDEQGQLLVTGAAPAGAADVTLRIYSRGEQLPTFSWKIELDRSEIVIALNDDDQARFDRPAIAQLRAVIDGCAAESTLCSVKQLSRLLRDRTGTASAGNRLQRVMDSGDGLVEYIDALDGVDAVIDFMNNTTIRFSNGGYSAGGNAGRWRPRDPFSGDVPDHWEFGSSGGDVKDLREAIWAFVQRHIQTRLIRHANRGNLGGLVNFLDIYRAMSRVLLAWHNRQIQNERVIPAPFVTTGLQEILAALIGGRGEDRAELPGYGDTLLVNLSADEDLVRDELTRNRVPAIIQATVDEMILVRAIAQKRPIYDGWANDRRQWISSWIAEMGLMPPSEADVLEIGAEFRLAA